MTTEEGKKRMTRRVIMVLILLASPLIAGVSPTSSAVIETQHLIVSDTSGKLPHAQLKYLADQAQTMLERVLAFWSADAGIGQFRKIRVIFDAPRRIDYYTSVFYMDKMDGQRIRAVRVFGYERTPQDMAHKFTSAVFPHEDKLIRNMMGVATEERIGNPLTHPGCGFRSDDWVLAFKRMNLLIPLNELGPDHESWGHKVAEDGFPAVFDRARQSKAYAEAGSFGNYLILTYGINKIKQFYKLSDRKERPWQDTFRMSLQELEANWLKALQAEEKTRDDNSSTLMKLFEKNPNTACYEAQKLVTRKQ